MRVVETALIGLLVLSAPAGFVAAASYGPSFIGDHFSGLDYGNIGKPEESSNSGKTPKKPAPKKPKPYPVEGPGLRGATLPHCSPGEYSAGYLCKPSPPNYYVPVGSLYPVACPPNTVAPIGSQSKSQCKPPETKGLKFFT